MGKAPAAGRGHRGAAAGAAAVALLLATGCAQRRCDGLELGREFAGEGAVECGDVEAQQDRTAAVACARQAHAEGSPFVLRIHSFGTDSAIAATFASSGARGILLEEDWFPCTDRTRPRCTATVGRRDCAIRFDEASIFCDGWSAAERVCE